MIEFKRNKETGILETYKDGKKVGEVITMGDEVKSDGKDGGVQLHDRDGQHRQSPGRTGKAESFRQHYINEYRRR